MGPNEIDMLAKTLSEVSVKNLHLYAHNISNEGARLFGKTLCATACLEKLTVRDCEIGVEGIELLFASLTENTTLVLLDASYNSFGDDGAVKIAGLINQTSIQVLDISNCNVREKGMVAIASALTTNTTLKRLSLYSPDEISENSEIELAKMLLKNKTLKMLVVKQHPDLYPHLTVYKELVLSTFKMSQALTLTLMNVVSTDEFYYGVKMSPIIASIKIHSASSLGKALLSYNMAEAEDILLLHQPPMTGESHIDLKMSGNTWEVNYVKGCIREKDAGLKSIHSYSPAYWAQLTKLNLHCQRLGSIGACHLADMLKQTQLQDLNISCCSIGEGIISLDS